MIWPPTSRRMRLAPPMSPSIQKMEPAAAPVVGVAMTWILLRPETMAVAGPPTKGVCQMVVVSESDQ